MAKTIIRVVLHGGLGNQLFQYFNSLILARRVESDGVILFPDLLGNYGTSRGMELNPLILSNGSPHTQVGTIDTLCRIRLPKIAFRLTGKEFVLNVPMYGLIVDGYFQFSDNYRAYSRLHVKELVEEWRIALFDLLNVKTKTGKLVTHIRLGDFFTSSKEASQFAILKLQELKCSTDIVTDQEELLIDVLKTLNLPFILHVIPSASMSSWELLALFSSYSRINTNGSTLALWAAVLANIDFESSNNEHMDIWRILTLRG